MTSLKLAWRIYPASQAIARLRKIAYPDPLPKAPGTIDRPIGILYAYSEARRPTPIAWVKPRDSTALRRLQHEATIDNHFAHHLLRRGTMDFWHIATAWTLYSAWLTQKARASWQVQLLREFEPSLALDGILAASNGWLLWKWQRTALMEIYRLPSKPGGTTNGDSKATSGAQRKRMHAASQFNAIMKRRSPGATTTMDSGVISRIHRLMEK